MNTPETKMTPEQIEQIRQSMKAMTPFDLVGLMGAAAQVVAKKFLEDLPLGLSENSAMLLRSAMEFGLLFEELAKKERAAG